MDIGVRSKPIGQRGSIQSVGPKGILCFIENLGGIQRNHNGYRAERIFRYLCKWS